MSKKKAKLPKHAAFVKALVEDPNHPPKTKVFVGFPGKAAKRKHTRIYLNARLSSYVEVPNRSILHHQRIRSRGRSILDGGHVVWVHSEAHVIEAYGVQSRKAKFLKGRIQHQNYPSSETDCDEDLGCDSDTARIEIV